MVKFGQMKTCPPPKIPNREKRSREYLTQDEVKQMIDSAKTAGRHGSRDALIILICSRHGLSVSELIDLRWEQFDLDNGLFHVNRLKNGTPSVHSLEGDEIRALRKLRREYENSAFVFSSERRGPLSVNAIHKIVVRAGQIAAIELSVHPHMLRHGKGYQLAAKGVDTRAIQAYLGHRTSSTLSPTLTLIQVNLKVLAKT